MAATWRDFLREKKRAPALDERRRGDILRLLRGRAIFDAPMREHTSLRVGGPADCLAGPATIEELKELLHYLRQEKLPYTIIGRGTNLLVRDGGIRGVTIRFGEGLRGWRREGETMLYAEAGLPVARLVRWGMEWGMEGCECLAGIPGSLGGALRMNAGTQNGEIKDVISRVGIIDDEGTFREMDRDEMGFAYRQSSLPKGAVIVSALLSLRKGEPEAVRKAVMDLLARRRVTQPLRLPNAGSIFRNPPAGPPAGRIIEECGLKNLRVKGAQVSSLHANVIVNVGGATAGDVLSLIELVREKVRELRGITLETEIVVVGEEVEKKGAEN